MFLHPVPQIYSGVDLKAVLCAFGAAPQPLTRLLYSSRAFCCEIAEG